MNEAKFTPGPWKFRQHSVDSQYFGNITGTYGKTPEGYTSIRTVALNLNHGTEEENMANAKLIEAAPVMYNALKDIRDIFESHGQEMFSNSVREIDKVLLQARG